jgi:hypothetical protein
LFNIGLGYGITLDKFYSEPANLNNEGSDYKLIDEYIHDIFDIYDVVTHPEFNYDLRYRHRVFKNKNTVIKINNIEMYRGAGRIITYINTPMYSIKVELSKIYNRYKFRPGLTEHEHDSHSKYVRVPTNPMSSVVFKNKDNYPQNRFPIEQPKNMDERSSHYSSKVIHNQSSSLPSKTTFPFVGSQQINPTATQPGKVVEQVKTETHHPSTTQSPSTTHPSTTHSSTTQSPTTGKPLTTHPSTTQSPSTTHPSTTHNPTTTQPGKVVEQVKTHFHHPPTTHTPTAVKPPTTHPSTTHTPTTAKPSTTHNPTTTQAGKVGEQVKTEPHHPPTTQSPTAVKPSTTHPSTTHAPTTAKPSTTHNPTTTQAGKVGEQVKTDPHHPSTTQSPKVVKPSTTHPSTTHTPTAAKPSTTHNPTTTQAGKVVEQVNTELHHPSTTHTPTTQSPTAVKPSVTSTEQNQIPKLTKFNDIMGQWYLIGTTYEMYYENLRSCQTVTFFKHDPDYFMKISVNTGNQTYSMVDYKISNIDTNGQTFQMKNNKYAYLIYSKTQLNYNEKLLHIVNLGNTTETFLYTEQNIVKLKNSEYRPDNVIHSKFNKLTPISLSCYLD